MDPCVLGSSIKILQKTLKPYSDFFSPNRKLLIVFTMVCLAKIIERENKDEMFVKDCQIAEADFLINLKHPCGIYSKQKPKRSHTGSLLNITV